jgi:hypothetical protein
VRIEEPEDMVKSVHLPQSQISSLRAILKIWNDSANVAAELACDSRTVRSAIYPDTRCFNGGPGGCVR